MYTVLVVSALIAYLLGSVSFGVVYSRLKGEDIRQKDAPGGSGVYRQYGLGAAVLVVFLDILKAVVAMVVAVQLSPETVWLPAFMVVLGHNFPIFFQFNGGGGIAPALGVWLWVVPQSLLIMLCTALVIMPIYKVFFQKKVRLNVIPGASALAIPLGMWLSYAYTREWAEVLAVIAAMALRIPFSLAPDLPPQES